MFPIGIFGRRNVGKSSLINAITEQNLAIVSDVAGTTTDPVKKSIELFDIGRTTIVDTAGFDDDSALGAQRIAKTRQALQNVDFAILAFSDNNFETHEKEWAEAFRKNNKPFLIVHNKSDLTPLNSELKTELQTQYSTTVIDVSAISKTNLNAIFDAIKKQKSTIKAKKALFDGLIAPNDVVLLVTPIDSEAPHERMILPQVQAIRSILDEHAIVIACQTEQLKQTLDALKTLPALVVTDSQAFAEVEAIIPKHCALTSFSILLARQKSDFETCLKGVQHISQLKDGDKVLILESCTHQSTCDDIGRVKIPNLFQKHTGKTLHIEIVSGLSPLPNDWETFAIVLQCGACMITQTQLQNRIKPFIEKGIPVTNYGMALACLNGILGRVIN